MAKFTNPLDNIKVASPCSADWSSMIGTDQKRFCGQCSLNVYNLSDMTKKEAESLIMNSEGRLCAKFYRRADGTVITKDCPVGWAAVKKKMSKIRTAIAALFVTAASGIGITAFVNQSRSEPALMGDISIENKNIPKYKNEPTTGAVVIEPEEEPVEIMGDVAFPYENLETEVVEKTAVSP